MKLFSFLRTKLMLQEQKNNDIKNELVELISQLISFKTTPQNFSEFNKTVKFIERYFAETNLFIQKHNFMGFPALFITTKQTKHPKILFQGHLDVVNGKDEQFFPKIIDGKLYGRGSVDMKAFVALAMKYIKENKNLDLGLIVTFDEEIGSENGAKKMFELGYSGDLIFNGDGGYNYSVIHGEKGILKFSVKTEANPGRHPYPWNGKNAFDLFLEDYSKLELLFPKNKIATEKENWHSTYAIYDVQVENDEFHTPNLVKAKFSVYFTEEITAENLFKKLQETFSNSVLEFRLKSERVFNNPDNDYILELQKIMTQQFEREIQVRTENGSSDARFYANSGIPIVIVKMVGEDHHGHNEHILISDILPMYNSMNDFSQFYFQKNINNEVRYAKEA